MKNLKSLFLLTTLTISLCFNSFALETSNSKFKTSVVYSSSGEVESVDEIELPIRQMDHGIYFDDFNRVVAKSIRKEAKKLFEEQEKSKEVSRIEDIVTPIYKITEDQISYSDCYNCNYEYLNCDKKRDITKPVHFYDDLGRKISDNLNIEANKIYNKQLRQEEWESWKDIDLKLLWNGFWTVISFAVCTAIIVLGITFVIKKLKEIDIINE